MSKSEHVEENNLISIVVKSVDDSPDSKAMFPSPKKLAESTIDMGTDVLAKNMRSFIKKFGIVLDSIQSSCGKDYELEQLTCSLSINSSGKISLIGEISSGVQSCITITFKKRKDKKYE